MAARSFDKKFTAQPYGWTVYFFTDQARWSRFVSRLTGSKQSVRRAEADDADGLTLTPDGTQIVCIGVFNQEPGTLAHEATHAANYMLARASVRFDLENDEAQAYLIGHIVDECIPALVARWKEK